MTEIAILYGYRTMNELVDYLGYSYCVYGGFKLNIGIDIYDRMLEKRVHIMWWYEVPIYFYGVSK